MTVEVKVPALGESIVEATVGRWLKGLGDVVAAQEPLVELETDKVNVEVAAPDNGIIESIVSPEGTTVGVGEVLAVLGDGNGARPTPPIPQAGHEPVVTATATEAPAAEIETRATPVARRMAEEHGINLADVPGSGPGGRVGKEDVEVYLRSGRRSQPAEPASSPAAARTSSSPPAPTASSTPSPAPHEAGREERVRLSRRRQTIARRLVEAQQTAAMLTTFNEVDMSAIMDIRRRRRDAFKQAYDVNLGFMSFFTKAVVGALRAQPRLNAEIQGDEMLLKYHYDIGIAVSTDEGLVVPVVRDADRLSFAEIERDIAVLAEKARDGRLGLADLQGGTFTITNGGVFGSLLSTPILNYPQVGILGMHKIQQRPVAVNGEIVIRPMMYLALSYDHRIVDGSEAVTFLVRVKELLEDPEKLLLEG
ncbi:MAG TPA: 2-oxoglutarate dehydrogenase complex dihydrolipoyllysine-residue succinyltransferase [Chloroflexota bacterium]|nr:2-oxoglutarate dehydrogenase complex dihydrolipoyllysine-residue succinyltransferase [Chloroflexota bacterium]